jgi:hypothetical protein
MVRRSNRGLRFAAIDGVTSNYKGRKGSARGLVYAIRLFLALASKAKARRTEKQKTEPSKQFSVLDRSVLFNDSGMASSKSCGAFVGIASRHNGSKK